MSSTSTSGPSVSESQYQFRCIACGHVSDSAEQDFRCAKCGDLLEIIYPYWKEGRPDPSQVKFVWQDRKVSFSSIDLSGVWRFRDVLPMLGNPDFVFNHPASTATFSLSPHGALPTRSRPQK